MRYKYSNVARDGNGVIISSGTVSLYLSGTTTPAKCYLSSTSTTVLYSVTTGADGSFTLYVDAFDYGSYQKYKIVISHSLFSNTYTEDNLSIDNVVTGTYTISTAKTFTYPVNIPYGVSFTKSGSGSLAFSAPPVIGLYQVFYNFTAGDVTFGSGAVKEVYPEWWGVTGTADDVAIQSAINSTTQPCVKLQPNKTYYISNTLLFSSVTGGLFEGSGMRSTVLQWSGSSTTDAMIRLFGVRETQFKNFTIVSSSTKPLYDGIRSETKAGFVSTKNTFSDIFTNGTNSGGLQYGYAHVSGTGGDNNNDGHSFIGCSYYNYMKSAIYIPTTQTQSKGLIFDHCGFAGGNLADYGVDSASSFAVFEGMGGYHNISDFRSYGVNDYVKIYGFNSEGSDRLYIQYYVGSGATGATMPVHIDGVRYDPAGVNADGYFIYMQSSGTLTLENSEIGSTASTSLTQIYSGSQAANNGGLSVKNVSFNQVNSESQSPFVFAGSWKGPVSSSGMMFRNSAGSGQTSKSNIFDDGDTTPAVFYKEGVYKASNTGATSITNFDAGSLGTIPYGWAITVYATTGNTTLVNGSTLGLKGATNYTMSTDHSITLFWNNSKWIELSRNN